MPDAEVARAIHVVAVILWIGGVGFVTLCLLPYCRTEVPPSVAVATFDAMERRFATVARVAILAAGLSGLWMVHRYQLWERFGEVAFWWMHAMVLVWLAFFMAVLMEQSPQPTKKRMLWAEAEPLTSPVSVAGKRGAL